MTELIIIFLIFIVSLVLIFKNFEFSVYVLITLSVLMHKELFSFYRWDLMPIRAFMFALMCAGILKTFVYFSKNKLSKIKDYLRDPVLVLLGLIWVVRGISTFFSKNLQASIFLYGFFTTVVFMCYYFYLMFKNSPEKVLNYLKYYIYLVFGLSLFGYFQVFLLQTTGVTIGALWYIPNNIPRVGATFWDVNHYGALLAALLPILSVLILIEGKLKQKIIHSVMVLSIFVSLLLTNSRTAWIMIFVAFLFFITVLLVRKVGAKGLLYVFLSLLLVTIPIAKEYSIKSSSFRARIKQYFHYRLDSFASHVMLLTGTYQIFEKYPILGGGYGSFFEHFSKTEVAPEYFGRDPAALNTRVPAHTIWGELIAETGVVGLSLFIPFILLLLFTPLYLAFRSKDKKTFMIGAAMSSVVFGWFVAGIFYSYNSEFFWLILIMFLTWSVGSIKNGSFKEVISFFAQKSKLILGVLALVSTILLFWNLGKNHLVPWDEAIYAKIAKNMVIDGEYIVQRWHNHWESVWYEKPPLYMWFMAFFMKILGFNAWAARLPSALFGLGTVIMTYLLGKKLFNKTVGFISGLALITTTQFLYYSRASMLDVTATFFLVLSLYIYLLAVEKEKRGLWILSGVVVGLSVMIKGVVGLLPFPIIVIYELYLLFTKQEKLNKERIMNYLSMFGASMVVSLPWHIEMYKRFGGEFLKGYIGYHVWDRAVSAIEDKGKPFFWYFIVLKVSMRIWFVGLLAAFPFSLFRSSKRDNKHVFLVGWSLFILLFFSIAKSKLTWYMIPVYPALCIMVGVFGERVLNFIMEKISGLNNVIFKFTAIYLITVFSLFYLYLNKDLVYTSDLTGAQVRMLEKKEELLGLEDKVYIHGMDLPIAYFYSNGPFDIIDFHPKKLERVPTIYDWERFVLVTKKGRFSEDVLTFGYTPQVLADEGDWVLWYFPPREEIARLKASGEFDEKYGNCNPENPCY
ncbi:glycosyltransferase family 39 protein [Patescibacteria group bacterium]